MPPFQYFCPLTYSCTRAHAHYWAGCGGRFCPCNAKHGRQSSGFKKARKTKKPSRAIVAIIEGKLRWKFHCAQLYTIITKQTCWLCDHCSFSLLHSGSAWGQIELREAQWENLKDSLRNLCVVHEAITPLQMRMRGKIEANHCVDKFNFSQQQLCHNVTTALQTV